MTEFFDHEAAASHHDGGAEHPAAVTHHGVDDSYTSSLGPMYKRDVQPGGEGELPVRRERVLPRKVLVGWALVTLFAYFTIRMVGTGIKEVVRGSVAANTRRGGSNSNGSLVIMLPNGKRITIRNDKRGQPAVEVSGPSTGPTTAAARAPRAPPAVPEPPAPAASKLPARK